MLRRLAVAKSLCFIFNFPASFFYRAARVLVMIIIVIHGCFLSIYINNPVTPQWVGAGGYYTILSL